MNAPVPRVVKFLIGLALLGYTVYELKTGYARGSWRNYNRRDDPGGFWTSIILKLVISGAFLAGVH